MFINSFVFSARTLFLNILCANLRYLRETLLLKILLIIQEFRVQESLRLFRVFHPLLPWRGHRFFSLSPCRSLSPSPLFSFCVNLRYLRDSSLKYSLRKSAASARNYSLKFQKKIGYLW